MIFLLVASALAASRAEVDALIVDTRRACARSTEDQFIAIDGWDCYLGFAFVSGGRLHHLMANEDRLTILVTPFEERSGDLWEHWIHDAGRDGSVNAAFESMQWRSLFSDGVFEMTQPELRRPFSDGTTEFGGFDFYPHDHRGYWEGEYDRVIVLTREFLRTIK